MQDTSNLRNLLRKIVYLLENTSWNSIKFVTKVQNASEVASSQFMILYNWQRVEYKSQVLERLL
jgi:hypothetical protein